MRKNYLAIALLALILIISCRQNTVVKNESTIDSTLQATITDSLKSKLVEYDAADGRIIVMDVQSGEVKAMVAIDSLGNAIDVDKKQPSTLIRTASILAALETDKITLEDTINTYNGVMVVSGDTLKDHNWKRGGYETVTVEMGYNVDSSIACWKTVSKVLDAEQYAALLNKMCYGDSLSIGKESFAWYTIGYNQQIAPIQILTFYNAIANNGKMVQPQLYKGDTIVVNENIAKHIQEIQGLMRQNITDGYGKNAKSDKVTIAGRQGVTQITDDTYSIEFCGYFPYEKPQYSIIVTLTKDGTQGGLAAEVAKGIAEYLTKR